MCLSEMDLQMLYISKHIRGTKIAKPPIFVYSTLFRLLVVLWQQRCSWNQKGTHHVRKTIIA